MCPMVKTFSHEFVKEGPVFMDFMEMEDVGVVGNRNIATMLCQGSMWGH